MSISKKYRTIDEKFKCYGSTLIEYIGDDEIVNIPNGIKKIGDMAFRRNPKNTKEIYLPKSVSKIGIAAFAYCPSLNFVYGENVKTVCEYAFWGCRKLKKVYLPKLKRFYWEAFSATATSVHMPSKAKLLWLSRR